MIKTGLFPNLRLRRNRKSDWIRRLTAENNLQVDDLIMPFFIISGANKKEEIKSLEGIYRFSIDLLILEVQKSYDLGIPAIMLFSVTDQNLKTANGEEAYNENNLICRAIKEIKKYIPDIGIICDVALDPYTNHGHDGLLSDNKKYVLNDQTIDSLCKQALCQAKAGCDMVAPSDMMDGRIGKIREFLDQNGYHNVNILSYSAKYASSFYGPFRDAVGSTKNLSGSDKKNYQMDYKNKDEAIREVALDIEEGADIVIVKPGLPYLDIVSKIKENFKIPVISYQISGEYSMLKLAQKEGIIDFEEALIETLTSFKRAGACGIITYGAMDIANKIRYNPTKPDIHKR